MSTKLATIQALNDREIRVIRFCGPDKGDGKDRRIAQVTIESLLSNEHIILDKEKAQELIDALNDVWGRSDLERTKTMLESYGLKVRVRRRKLAGGEKVYIVLQGCERHYDFYHLWMPKIRDHFPDAYMTSGGFGTDDSTQTIALEK